MGFQSFEERAKKDPDYIRRRLEIHGGYDKHGDVFGIARPLPGPVLLPLKTFHDAKAREQFIDEFTFFQYRDRRPSWRSVLFASDCFSDEDKSSKTLQGKSYTPDRGKAYVTQLIASGELVVYYTGSSIPPGDRNHHLPWREPRAKEEILPVVDQFYQLGPHDGPGYEHPEKPEPQVSIAEAPLVEWTIPESGESGSIVLHATGTPSGGTYAWTGVDKTVCSLSTPPTGKNIEIKPIGEGSFRATVSYSLQGEVAKDVVEVKVVPNKLSNSQILELGEKKAQDYAKHIKENWDNVKPSPNARKPSTIDVIVTRDGEVFEGYNTRKGHPNFDNPLATVDEKIKEAYDSVPKEKRMASTHGRCAEVSALQRAIDAGADLDGAMSISVDVKTGAIKNACKSCVPALKHLGINDGVCKL